MASRLNDMAVLNDDRKNSNPRAASIRIQADTMSGYSGQRRHDLRIGEIPNYVDDDRVGLNRTLIIPPPPAEMREIAKERRGRREIQRKMKSNAAIATAGIITFGSEAAQLFEELPKAEQDRAFRDLAEAVARRLNTSLHSLVIHLDEATIHAHFHLCSYDLDGLPLSKTTRPQILSELQDLTAEVMQRYCPEIERGTRYGDRLAAGADYADVINKSVKQLHRELPGDLARKQAEVEALERAREEADAARAASEKLAEIAARVHKENQDAEAATRTKLREVEDRLADLEAQEQNARERVTEMQGRVDKLTAKESLTEKETKRLETYQKRLTDRIAELEAAEATAEAARADAEAGAARVKAEAERIRADAEAERIKAEEAADAATERARAAEARQAEATARAAIVRDGLNAVVTELAAGTLRRSEDGRLRAKDPAPLRAAHPEIKPAIGAAVEVVETAAQSLRKARQTERDAQRKREETEAELAREREAVEQEKAKLEAAFERVIGWMHRLEPLIARFTAWLDLPGLPKSVRDEGLAIMRDAARTAEGLKKDGPGT